MIDVKKYLIIESGREVIVYPQPLIEKSWAILTAMEKVTGESFHED